MSPLDFPSITEKKSKLMEAVNVLKQLRKSSAIRDDLIIQGSALYYLVIGIEAILDIGSHILLEEYQARPDSYEDIIRLLGRHKVISLVLSKRSIGMAKFRNRVIHEYTKVDIKRVLNYLQEAPEQFSAFDRAFSLFLKKKKRK